MTTLSNPALKAHALKSLRSLVGSDDDRLTQLKLWARLRALRSLVGSDDDTRAGLWHLVVERMLRSLVGSDDD